MHIRQDTVIFWYWKVTFFRHLLTDLFQSEERCVWKTVGVRVVGGQCCESWWSVPVWSGILPCEGGQAECSLHRNEPRERLCDMAGVGEMSSCLGPRCKGLP